MKKVIAMALCVVMLFSLTACGRGLLPNLDLVSSNTQAASDFYDCVVESQALLDEVADDIYSCWYDYVYEDEYTSVDMALYVALAINEDNLTRIEELDVEIASLFKDAKESKCGPQVKAVMSAYSDYYELVVNVSGSFSTYSESKEKMKKELASCLKDLSYEL